MAVASHSFAATPQLRSLTLINLDLWAWGERSLRGLTALTRLDLTEGQIAYVPSALMDVRNTLRELALELANDGAPGGTLDRRAAEVLLCLGQLEGLRIRKACQRDDVAWSNAEVGRLIGFPAAFLAQHPARSQPPLLVCE